MSKRIKKILAMSLVAGTLTSMNVTAFAAESSNKSVVADKQIISSVSNKVSEQDKTQLKTWMKKYGVNETTQNNLLNKLDKGDLWDSINSKSPVKTEKLDSNSIKNTYADGSILISGRKDGVSISNDKSDISLNSMKPGKTTSGSGYMNVTGSKIYFYGGVINAEFYADYTFVNRGYDRINKIYKKHVLGIGCTVSSISLDMIQDIEDANAPAQATLSFTVSAYGGYGGGNMDLDLFVGKDHATATDID